MWTVIAVSLPKANSFRADYFPRACHYKKDAEKLAKEVEAAGGVAKVVKGKVTK